MRVLLDTHTLLWAFLSPIQLSRPSTEIIADHANTILVSPVSAWEIATKVRKGQLPQAEKLERAFTDKVKEAGYELTCISVENALRAGRFTGSHRDPFDRILAAQALAMDIPILSTDKELDAFGVRRIW